MKLLPFVGLTMEGGKVHDIFYLHDTMGIPLEVLLESFQEHHLTVSWSLFYEQALAKGWNPRTTVSKMEAAVQDTRSPEYLDSWKQSLEKYLTSRHGPDYRGAWRRMKLGV